MMKKLLLMAFTFLFATNILASYELHEYKSKKKKKHKQKEQVTKTPSDCTGFRYICPESVLAHQG